MYRRLSCKSFSIIHRLKNGFSVYVKYFRAIMRSIRYDEAGALELKYIYFDFSHAVVGESSLFPTVINAKPIVVTIMTKEGHILVSSVV